MSSAPRRRILFSHVDTFDEYAPDPSDSVQDDTIGESVREEGEEEQIEEVILSTSGVRSILCVGEKPSIAQSIAAILSHGSYETTRGSTPVHSEYMGWDAGEEEDIYT